MTDPQARLPLFEAYPRLADALPRIAIGHWPTPIEQAERFAAEHDIERLFVKREDLSHPRAGGNKVRGLEFLLADARAREAAA